MRARLLLLALAIGCLPGCLTLCVSTDRFSCQDNAECDKSGGEICGGFEVWADKSCNVAPKPDQPFYISEPEPPTCYFSFCVLTSKRECGAKSCSGDTTCIGSQAGEKIALECHDRQAMNNAPACDSFDPASNCSDATTCDDGRRVRYLEFRRDNPTGTDLGYRCLR